ncbi:MAG: response regulator [Deferribacteraceae bacterium]|jgi:signal transduction histidine kinase/CheY-like chemotaxis protein/HPt (histidine-containing phosphotransfer) domain-containing protein|nr:response regulator [Deferribacteraceae bacterium]
MDNEQRLLEQIARLEKENSRLSRQYKSLEGLVERTKITIATKERTFTRIYNEKSSREKFLNLLLKNSTNIILLFNQDYKLVYCTDIFLLTAGISNFAMVNSFTFKEILEIFTKYDEREQLLQFFQFAMEEKQNVTIEEVIDFSGTGSFRHYLILISPMLEENGELAGSIVTFQDLTDMIMAKNQAEQANVAKSIFLANMSHEIRTPMNAVMGMSELILRENVSSAVYGYAASIRQASESLLAIINDILDYSKIESGTLEIIPAAYNLPDMLNDVINIIRARLLNKPIFLYTDIDPSIPISLFGDVLRIRQILLNILSNAAKYTDEGYIVLSVESRKINNVSVLLNFTVQDTGVGIKKEDLPKLFGTFVQLDALHNRGREGTGLGLAISKNLCNRMGGDISCTSVYGEGSTFLVVIPQTILDAAPIASVRGADKLRLLIYDPYAEAEFTIKAAKNLEIHTERVKSQSEFTELLSKNDYNFMFIHHILLESALDKLEKMGKKTRVVAMVEYGVSFESDIDKIILPVNSINMAALINDDGYYRKGSEPLLTFRAPNAKVLVVDDIFTNLTVVKGLLKPFDMQVDIAISGLEALELARRNRYDIIFMDHMMPKMDGVEATNIIRDFPAPEDNPEFFKQLPIIALTANAMAGTREMFIKNGLNDYLAKPIEIPKLNAILDKWIPTEKKIYAALDEQSEEIHFEIEGIDCFAGFNFAGRNINNYLSTLTAYLYDGRIKKDELEETVQKHNWQLFTTYVHALKSASACIGAKDLSKSAQELEMAGRKGDEAFIAVHYPIFLKQLLITLDKIDGALKDWRFQRSEPSADETELKSYIAKLTEAVKQTDVLEAENILNKLQGVKMPEELDEAIQKVAHCILLSDYDVAETILNKLV